MSTKTIEVRHPGKAWVAWTNTDTTEGRGAEVPLAVCDKEATAIRLGKKGSVQGCDCHVTEVETFHFGGRIYGPIRLTTSTKEDEYAQNRLDARHAAEKAAREAGLTNEQIRALSTP